MKLSIRVGNLFYDSGIVRLKISEMKLNPHGMLKYISQFLTEINLFKQQHNFISVIWVYTVKPVLKVTCIKRPFVSKDHCYGVAKYQIRRV